MERMFHTWDRWECYPAGMYEIKPPERHMTAEWCKLEYMRFLADLPRFKVHMAALLREWPNSTEHYLSNERMNRIAWLGQAAMCHATRIPAIFCGGYNLLSDEQKAEADEAALEYLNLWLAAGGYEPATMEVALGRTQANLY